MQPVTKDVLDLCDGRRDWKKKRYEAAGANEYRETNMRIQKTVKKAKEYWIGAQCEEIETYPNKNNSKRAYSTDIVFLCRFSVWSEFPRRFRLVWQTVFLRFRLHRFVPFSIRKSVCVTDQSKAVTRRFHSLQKTSFTHAQILLAETLFRQEPIRFT